MACNLLNCIYGDCVIPQRYILCVMSFFAVLISYTMRVCLNFAITEMVVTRPIQISTFGRTHCLFNMSHKDEPSVKGGRYEWTELQQAIILGAFFPGYAITHLQGQAIADSCSPKQVISGGVALSGLLTVLTPLAVQMGDWMMLSVMRFFVGLAQGPLYPCLANLLAKWVLPRERSAFGAVINTGNHLGSILGNIFSCLLMVSVNWQVVFYFWGGMAFAWYIIFITICYSEPLEHPFITLEELEMLEDLGPIPRFPVPWKQILKDRVTWALVAGQAGHDWIFLLIVVYLPKYMKDVLKFGVIRNGVLNSIPYLCLWISSVLSGITTNYVINRELVSILRMRQIYTLVGNVGSGACVIFASLLGCNRILAAIMFSIGMFVMGPFYAGLKVNVVDVTRNFAGSMMSLVNGMGSLLFCPVPYAISVVVINNTLEEWRLIFTIVFVLSVITTLVYIFFTSTEQAYWD